MMCKRFALGLMILGLICGMERVGSAQIPEITLGKTLKGHDNTVFSVAFSPDGKYLASGSRDNTIKLWEIPTPPPFLTVKAKFDDTLTGANGLLDSGEEASLILSISNTGEGSGFGIEILPSIDNTVVTIPEIIRAGAIPSEGTREIRIPISASKDAQNGAVTVTIATKEMYGYDAQTVRFTIPVHRIEMPVLEIADIGKVIINDKPPVIKSATAEVKKKMESLVQIKGNGNGIIENEEIVEITVPVQNIGQGNAYGVKLGITSIDSEIEVLNKEIVLGNIEAGKSKEGKFLFKIPKTYLAENSPAPQEEAFPSLIICVCRS